MPRTFLSSAKPGDLLDDVFLISNTQLAAGSNGKLYIKGFLSDRTAQFTARIWNASPELFALLPEGGSGFIHVKGRVENFQNNLQAIIDNFKLAADNAYQLADLVPTTPKNIDEMNARLRALLNSLQHKETKAIVQEFLADESLMRDFARAPAASTFHHAYMGGLLEHTVSLMEVAEKLLPLYPGLSRDLTLAGLFLHDIAKTWELSYDSAFAYTSGGQLIGHVVKAALWTEEKAAKASEKLGHNISRQLIDTLQHIILAHHGLPEHGAAKPPMTPEALFVHLLDNLDAKMMMALTATRPPLYTPANLEQPTIGGGWTDVLKSFGQRFYRPDPTLPATLESPILHMPPAMPSPAPQPEPPSKPLFSNPLFEMSPAKKK